MNKVCCFYASEEHLMSILLPYINEKLKENQNVVTILEKDIGKGIGSLKKVFNFTKDEWKKIEGVLKRKQQTNNLKDSIIIIVGSNQFIKDKHEIISEENIVISCYAIMQDITKIEKVLEESDKILNTTGVKEITEIFTNIPNKSYKKITIVK